MSFHRKEQRFYSERSGGSRPGRQKGDIYKFYFSWENGWVMGRKKDMEAGGGSPFPSCINQLAVKGEGLAVISLVNHCFRTEAEDCFRFRLRFPSAFSSV